MVRVLDMQLNIYPFYIQRFLIFLPVLKIYKNISKKIHFFPFILGGSPYPPAPHSVVGQIHRVQQNYHSPLTVTRYFHFGSI